MLAVKSYRLERPRGRMLNGSLDNLLKPSVGRKRRDISFVTGIAAYGDIVVRRLLWAFEIVRPRRDHHGRTDIVKG
jgi:hypothetical protein